MKKTTTKKYFLTKMTEYLENSCGYFEICQKETAKYYAGMADGVRDCLESLCNWDISEADDYVCEMNKYIDEEWNK